MKSLVKQIKIFLCSNEPSDLLASEIQKRQNEIIDFNAQEKKLISLRIAKKLKKNRWRKDKVFINIFLLSLYLEYFSTEKESIETDIFESLYSFLPTYQLKYEFLIQIYAIFFKRGQPLPVEVFLLLIFARFELVTNFLD